MGVGRWDSSVHILPCDSERRIAEEGSVNSSHPSPHPAHHYWIIDVVLLITSAAFIYTASNCSTTTGSTADFRLSADPVAGEVAGTGTALVADLEQCLRSLTGTNLEALPGSPPGAQQSLVSATALGSLEWTWLEPVPLATSDWICALLPPDEPATVDRDQTTRPRVGTYIVAAGGTELQCVASSGGQQCPHPTTLWTSGYGTPWEELTAETGELRTATVSTGRLGMVAVTTGSSCPEQPVLFSPDGAAWEELIDIAAGNGDTSRSWLAPAVVGSETIILVGIAEGPPSPHLFIAVGQLVDQ